MSRNRLLSILLTVIFSSTVILSPLAITVTSDYSGPTYWGETIIVRFMIADTITQPGHFYLAADIINVYVTCDFGTFEYKGAELHVQRGSTNYSLDVPMEISVPWWTEEREYLTVLHFTYSVPQTGWTRDYTFNGPIIQVKGYLAHIAGGAIILIAIVAGLIYRDRRKSRFYRFGRQSRRQQSWRGFGKHC